MTKKKKESFSEKLRNNPVIFTDLIKNGIALGIAFGLSVSAVQLAAIMLFVNSGISTWVWASVEPIVKRQARDVQFLNEVAKRQEIAISDQTQKARARTERAQGRTPTEGGRLKSR